MSTPCLARSSLSRWGPFSTLVPEQTNLQPPLIANSKACSRHHVIGRDNARKRITSKVPAPRRRSSARAGPSSPVTTPWAAPSSLLPAGRLLGPRDKSRRRAPVRRRLPIVGDPLTDNLVATDAVHYLWANPRELMGDLG
jgi:hypothetical protein